MDIKSKKQLREDYKNRYPEMGVISYRCKATGESFLGISEDTAADFNSTNFKLNMNGHPNKHLQELWSLHGQDGFELSVIRVLKYDDPSENHTRELEELRQQCLESDAKAGKIWR